MAGVRFDLTASRCAAYGFATSRSDMLLVGLLLTGTQGTQRVVETALRGLWAACLWFVVRCCVRPSKHANSHARYVAGDERASW